MRYTENNACFYELNACRLENIDFGLFVKFSTEFIIMPQCASTFIEKTSKKPGNEAALIIQNIQHIFIFNPKNLDGVVFPSIFFRFSIKIESEWRFKFFVGNFFWLVNTIT